MAGARLASTSGRQGWHVRIWLAWSSSASLPLSIVKMMLLAGRSRNKETGLHRKNRKRRDWWGELGFVVFLGGGDFFPPPLGRRQAQLPFRWQWRGRFCCGALETAGGPWQIGEKISRSPASHEPPGSDKIRKRVGSTRTVRGVCVWARTVLGSSSDEEDASHLPSLRQFIPVSKQNTMMPILRRRHGPRCDASIAINQLLPHPPPS